MLRLGLMLRLWLMFWLVAEVEVVVELGLGTLRLDWGWMIQGV